MPIRHIGRGRFVALPILDPGVWVVIATPRLLYPRKETRYPLYRRLGGPRSRSGWVRKILSPAGFKPRQDEMILLPGCIYSTPRIQLRPPIYTRMRKSCKVHFLKNSPLLQLYTSARDCKGVVNIPGSHFVKTFPASPSHFELCQHHKSAVPSMLISIEGTGKNHLQPGQEIVGYAPVLSNSSLLRNP